MARMGEVELVVGLLLLTVLFVALASRWRTPYPIVLMLVGLALALIPGLPTVRLDPDVILVLFLPPLIHAAALETSVQELRQDARTILQLAVGLVLATAGAVALVAHSLVPDLPWAAALVLGAAVSPPDTVSATQIASAVGLPRRLVTILGGEGLINDGTALTSYNLAVMAAVSGGVTFGSVVGGFGYAVVVGVGIGLVVAAVVRFVLGLLTDPLLESTLLLVMPFAAYLPAEALGASGVLAVVTTGLAYVRYGARKVSAAGRLQQRSFWQLVEFVLTALSFLLIGLELRSIVSGLEGISILRLTVQAAAVSGTVIVLRVVWVLVSGLLRNRRARTTERRPVRGLLVAGWSGMRGVIAIAIALAIPDEVPQRPLLVFLAFTVILVTLLGQGLTLGPLATRLGVLSRGERHMVEQVQIRLRTAGIAQARLQDHVDRADLPEHVLERFTAAYEVRVDRLQRILDGAQDASVDEAVQVAKVSDRLATQRLKAELIGVEQAELARLVDQGLDQRTADAVRQRLDVDSLLPGT